MKATRVCSMDGCGREFYARGICRTHYDAARRRGEIPPLPPVAERIRRRLIARPNGCLEWTGSTGRDGYGNIRFGGSTRLVHRAVWELANGPIPEGIEVCHHCDNPPCCETEPTDAYPDGHLFLGTHADNMADRDAKGRLYQLKITHCPQGHEYAGENLYTYPDGRRRCRMCSRAENISRRHRRRQEALSRA